jgi:hypothetical protein
LKTLKLPLLLNTITVLSLFTLLGCVNRGSHTDITTPGGDSGVGGSIVPPTDGPKDQEPPPQDSGGPDVVFVDNCDVDGGDAGGGDASVPSSCTAMFNFESPGGCGLYGAFLNASIDNPPATEGFTRLYHTPLAFCGRGALAVDVDFNRDAGIGGEIVLPISRLGVDYTGKVLSLAMRGSVAGGPNVYFAVLPVTSRYESPAIRAPITTDWVTLSVTLPSPEASASGVIELSLQAHGAVDYKGTIYIDEIDVRNPSDGGASDGPVDAPAGDTRDAGAGDVRDAPAGS